MTSPNGTPDRIVFEQNEGGGGGATVTIDGQPIGVHDDNVYARLADLLIALDNIKIDADSVNLNTDQLEALEQEIIDLITARLPAALDGDGGLKVHVENPTTTVTANLGTIDDVATETTLSQFVGPYSIPVIGSKNTATVDTLLTPSSGHRLQVRRLWVKGAYDIPDGVGVEFIVKLGTTVIAHDDVISSQPYADGVVKLGDVDEALTLELLTAQKVFYNMAVEEI